MKTVEAVVHEWEGKWVGRIDSPDRPVTKTCASPGPLVTWMHEGAESRGVGVTVTVWAGAAPGDRGVKA